MTTVGDFNPATDPFSTTYTALTTGQSSWRGGFKCITINGQPALQYLKTSEMTWGEYWEFLNGQGAFDATRISAILRDDKMTAGIRRCFCSTVGGSEVHRDRVKAAIEQNVHRVLLAAGTREDEAVQIEARIIGDQPAARNRATETVARNLFQTNDALKDLKHIVDMASTDPSDAKRMIQEVFSYALPDEKATKEVDDQIARGIGILIDNGATVQQVFDLFKEAYGETGTVETIIRRFLPLVLQSMSLVQYPIQSMKELLTFLESKLQSGTEAARFIEEAQRFVQQLESNKKGKEDLCFLAVPLLKRACAAWPVVESANSLDVMRHLQSSYATIQGQSGIGAKESLPGLVCFAGLLLAGEDVFSLFSVRPQTFRTGDEKKDVQLFFHHIVESAQRSDRPAAVVKISLPLLSAHLKGSEYESFVEDMRQLLPLLEQETEISKKTILPLLEAIVPKKEQRPSIKPAEAERTVVTSIFAAIQSAQYPIHALEQILPSLQKRIPPEYADLIPQIQDLLIIMKTHSDGALVVTNLLVPLLEGIIDGKGDRPTLGSLQACATIADAVYLAKQGESLSNLLYGTIKEISTKIETAAVDSLRKSKEEAIAFVEQQSRAVRGASKDFTCRAAFIFPLGSLLASHNDAVNLPFLSRIREVFFGSKGSLGTERSKEVERDILQALARAPDTDYHERLIAAEVPAIVRGWAGT